MSLARVASACLVLLACHSGGAMRSEPGTPAPAPPTLEPAVPAPPAIRLDVLRAPIQSTRLRHRLTLASWPGALAWSPDAARLATGDDDGRVQIWDARTGQPVHDLGKHERRTTALVWSPAGDLLAVAASIDLRVWDPADGAELQRLRGHGDLILDLRFVGRELLAVDLRNALRRWDPRTGQQLGERDVPTIHKLALAIAPDGGALAMGGYGDLELLDLTTGAVRFHHDMPRCDQHPDDLLCAAWKPRRVEEFGHEGGPPSTHEDISPNWHVQDLAFSADGARLLAGRADGVAILLDVASGRPLARYAVGDDRHAFVALSPDGSLAAAADHDGLVVVWDTATSREHRLAHDPRQHVNALAFAPDASALAAAGPGQAVTIWDLVR